MKFVLTIFLTLTSAMIYSQQTVELCPENRHTFTYFSSSNSEGNWLWTVNNDTMSYTSSVLITWVDTGYYVIMARFDNECDAPDRYYRVHVIECAETAIYFPNAFTPNDDGINDRWGPKGVKIAEIEWYVFDRWGVEVYHSNSMTDLWNGSFRGGEYYVQEDVYVYKAAWKDINGQHGDAVGHIVLIR